MEPFNLHHPNVHIIWNFYPFNWFILPPLSWLLNIIILPVTLVAWPLWETWNFLNLFWAILFFPVWLIGFLTYNFFLVVGWIALIILSIIFITVPLVVLFGISIYVSLQSGNWIFALAAILVLGLLTLTTLCFLWLVLFGLPVSIVVGIIIWATVPCLTEDAAA